jgi:hypothetical protein
MTCVWIKKGTPHLVTQVRVSPAMLDAIGNILNIPQAQRGQLIGATIYIDVAPPPSPPGGGGPPSSPGGDTPPSSPSGGRRSRK